MSLRLYLDDCAFSWRLRDILLLRGHEVVTPRDVDLLGADDDIHFAYTRRQNLVIITANPKDFSILHQSHSEHPGILAIYQDNDPRDMSYEEIAQAIQNIVDAGLEIAGQFHVLNMWRF